MPRAYNKPEFGPCAPVAAALLTDWGSFLSLAENLQRTYYSFVMALIPIKTASETGYCDCICGCYELASLRDEDTGKGYCPACGKGHVSAELRRHALARRPSRPPSLKCDALRSVACGCREISLFTRSAVRIPGAGGWFRSSRISRDLICTGGPP